MAKINKLTKKKRQAKKNTQKSGRNCKSPIFFLGGRVNKRKRKGKGKVASCTFFGGDNGDNNAPYPINTKINAIEFPISTRTMPSISGGKSNRNKNGTTRKRVKKLKGGSSILATGDPEAKIMPTVLNNSNASAAISGDPVGNNNVFGVPAILTSVNV